MTLIKQDDLKKLFEEVKAKGDKTKRLPRSEAAEAEENKKNEAIDAIMNEESKQEEQVDALEFAPEVNILTTFDGEWQDATAALAKWNEKKAKLDELASACDNKRIKTGNFDSMALFLKKEIAATNVNIATAAVLAAAALATGLRKDFGAACKLLIAPALQKLKEKKIAVHEAVAKFLTAAIQCSTLQEICEEIVASIKHVAPAVKTGAIKFVEQIAQVTYIDVLQNSQAELLPAMVKAIEDKDGAVRELALHCMGILKGRLTESVTAKYLKDVNK